VVICVPFQLSYFIRINSNNPMSQYNNDATL
jgi:hypothetical protein